MKDLLSKRLSEMILSKLMQEGCIKSLDDTFSKRSVLISYEILISFRFYIALLDSM